MKLVEAMYGWNRNSDEIDVGPWPDTTGWSDRYSLTGGACYTNIRQMAPDQLAAQIFIDFHMIVLRDGVDVQAAHRAFLKIDEFRRSIAPETMRRSGRGEESRNTPR
jgi:hypothetical protein